TLPSLLSSRRTQEIAILSQARPFPLPSAIGVDFQHPVVKFKRGRGLIEIDVRDGVVGEVPQAFIELSRSKRGAHAIQYCERRPCENQTDDDESLLVSQ